MGGKEIDANQNRIDSDGKKIQIIYICNLYYNVLDYLNFIGKTKKECLTDTFYFILMQFGIIFLFLQG